MTFAAAAEPVFLAGPKVVLRPLLESDASAEYLSWLNDPLVLKHSSRKTFPTTMSDLKRYLGNIPASGDVVLAVCEAATRRHVGNIALNSIVWPFGSAELSIMLGAKDIWGKGYARNAIELLTAHAFESMGLRRLWAESPNPAFNAVMDALGWTREGVKREAFLLDGKFVDFECWGLLKGEYLAAGRKS